jgi:ribosomal protein L16/L10AE
MGRGKGNVSYWYCTVKPGHVLFEIIAAKQYSALIVPALQFSLRKLSIRAQIISR